MSGLIVGVEFSLQRIIFLISCAVLSACFISSFCDWDDDPGPGGAERVRRFVALVMFSSDQLVSSAIMVVLSKYLIAKREL